MTDFEKAVREALKNDSVNTESLRNELNRIGLEVAKEKADKIKKEKDKKAVKDLMDEIYDTFWNSVDNDNLNMNDIGRLAVLLVTDDQHPDWNVELIKRYMEAVTGYAKHFALSLKKVKDPETMMKNTIDELKNFREFLKSI